MEESKPKCNCSKQQTKDCLREIVIPNPHDIVGIQVISLQEDGSDEKIEKLTDKGYNLFKVLIKQAASQKFPTTFEMIVGIFIKRG